MTGDNQTKNQRTTTRRTALKLFGGLAGVGGASALGLGVFSQSGRATVNDGSFTAADVELSSDDGTVTDIWLRPDLAYSWEGLNSPPETVSFTVEAETPSLDGGYELLGSEDDTEISGGTTGEDAYEFAAKLSLMDGSWVPSDFQPTEGAEKETGPITVRITAELQNGDENSPYTDSATAEFSVIVTDDEVTFGGTNDTGINGEAGTGGSTGDGGSEEGPHNGDDNDDNGNGNGNGNNGNGKGNGNNGNGNGNGNNGKGNQNDDNKDDDNGDGD